jgi:hypothetical protein
MYIISNTTAYGLNQDVATLDNFGDLILEIKKTSNRKTDKHNRASYAFKTIKGGNGLFNDIKGLNKLKIPTVIQKLLEPSTSSTQRQ